MPTPSWTGCATARCPATAPGRRSRSSSSSGGPRAARHPELDHLARRQCPPRLGGGKHTGLSGNGELPDHPEGVMVFAVELGSSGLREGDGHRGGRSGAVDILIDVLAGEREVVLDVAHILEREGHLLARATLENRRLEVVDARVVVEVEREAA